MAAKIEALCDVFPKKTKTEIIGDLLATALDDVAEGFSNQPYPDEAEDAAGIGSEAWWGDRGRYDSLVRKHLSEMDGDSDNLRDGSSETADSNKDDNPNISDVAAVGGPRKASRRLARSRRPKK